MVDSFLKYHPDGRTFVMIVDGHAGYIDPDDEQFTLITPDVLDIPDIDYWHFKLTPKEMCMVMKPRMLHHVLTNYDVEYLCHIDNDMHIYAPLDEMVEALQKNHIVYTPHIVTPAEATIRHQLYARTLGLINTGIVGVRNTLHTRSEVLPWWAEYASKYPIEKGQKWEYRDQAWADAILLMFDHIGILRDQTYNVGPWNLVNRPLSTAPDGTWLVNNQPLKTMHFSKFSYETGELPHNGLADQASENPLAEIEAAYQQALKSNSLEDTRDWPYAFSAFDDGIPIPAAVRGLWVKADAPEGRWANPFNTSHPDSFREWANQADPQYPAGKPILTRLAIEIFHRDPIIKSLYSIREITGRERFAYGLWFTEKAAARRNLPDFFIEPVRASLPASKLLRHRLRFALRGILKRIGLLATIKRILRR